MSRIEERFKELAKSMLVFIGPGDRLPEGMPIVRRLATDEQLSRKFPEGELYRLCANHEEGWIVVIATDERAKSRAIREAAMGFSDNMRYR